MKEKQALELVKLYALTNKAIKGTTNEIAQSLDNCQGISGKRKSNESAYFEFESTESRFDSKGRDTDLHLTKWYTPEMGGDSYGPVAVYEYITDYDHGVQCKYCYEAHLLIQKRKELKKKFGIIKRTMSRVK